MARYVTAARGKFGRLPKASPDLSTTLVSIATQMADKEDSDMLSAWKSGGLYDGHQVTDQELLSHFQQRMAGMSNQDPEYWRFQELYSQYDFSIAESKVNLAYKQGKMNDDQVAKFYTDWAKKVNPNTQFYRDIMLQAASFIKAADTGRSRRDAAGRAQARDNQGNALLNGGVGGAAQLVSNMLDYVAKYWDAKGGGDKGYQNILGASDAALMAGAITQMDTPGTDLYKWVQANAALLKQYDPTFNGHFTIDYIRNLFQRYENNLTTGQHLAAGWGNKTWIDAFNKAKSTYENGQRDLGMWTAAEDYQHIMDSYDAILNDPNSTQAQRSQANKDAANMLNKLAAVNGNDPGLQYTLTNEAACLMGASSCNAKADTFGENMHGGTVKSTDANATGDTTDTGTAAGDNSGTEHMGDNGQPVTSNAQHMQNATGLNANSGYLLNPDGSVATDSNGNPIHDPNQVLAQGTWTKGSDGKWTFTASPDGKSIGYTNPDSVPSGPSAFRFFTDDGTGHTVEVAGSLTMPKLTFDTTSLSAGDSGSQVTTPKTLAQGNLMAGGQPLSIGIWQAPDGTTYYRTNGLWSASPPWGSQWHLTSSGGKNPTYTLAYTGGPIPAGTESETFPASLISQQGASPSSSSLSVIQGEHQMIHDPAAFQNGGVYTMMAGIGGEREHIWQTNYANAIAQHQSTDAAQATADAAANKWESTVVGGLKTDTGYVVPGYTPYTGLDANGNPISPQQDIIAGRGAQAGGIDLMSLPPDDASQTAAAQSQLRLLGGVPLTVPSMPGPQSIRGVPLNRNAGIWSNPIGPSLGASWSPNIVVQGDVYHQHGPTNNAPVPAAPNLTHAAGQDVSLGGAKPTPNPAPNPTPTPNPAPLPNPVDNGPTPTAGPTVTGGPRPVGYGPKPTAI